MPSLYRKYRPATFDQVIGQDFIKQTIQNEIKTDKLSHAYLFSGPRGVGKTTLARLIAKAVNCKNRKDGEFEPCDKCDSCLEINKNKSVDLVEIDAASNRRIDDIRELREKVRYSPASSRFKVIIVDEVHMLTREAFNALLKTLEEPPAYAIFILATTEIHKVPDTIISRCQRFDFKRVEFKDIVKRLKSIVKQEGYKVDDEVLQSIAYHSEGHPRDAESLLSQVLAIVSDKKKISSEDLELILPASNFDLVIEFVEYIFKDNLKGALKLVNNITSKGIDLKNFTQNSVKMLHRMILVKSGLSKLTWQIEKSLDKKIHKMVKNIDNVRLVEMIEALNQAKKNLDSFSLKQIALEIAILKLCDSDKSVDIDKKDDVDGDSSSSPSKGEEREKETEEGKSKINETTVQKIEAKVKEKINQVVSKRSAKEEVVEKPKKQAAQEQQEVDDNEETKEAKVSMYEIKGKWPQIVRKVGEKNRSLVALLEVCKIDSFEKKCLMLKLPYKIYLDKIKQVDNNELIQQVAQEVLGAKISIDASQGEKTKVKFKSKPQVVNQEAKSQDAPEMNNLLEAFGGEVVG